VGSVIVMLWEWRAPQSAAHYVSGWCWTACGAFLRPCSPSPMSRPRCV
jgi:hypothetical protein